MECCDLDLTLGRRLRCRGTITIDEDSDTKKLCLLADNGEKYLVTSNEVWAALMELVGEELEIVGIVCPDDLGNLNLTVQSYRIQTNDGT